MLRIFQDEEKKRKVMKQAKQLWDKSLQIGKNGLEKGLKASGDGVKKAWNGMREERARREREKAYQEEYEAQFRYHDNDLTFEMLISADEAKVYEKAKRKLKEVKRLHSDPRVHMEWEAKKYLSLHDYFTAKIDHYIKRRNEDPLALHRAIRYCERQIEYAPVAKKAYQMDPYNFGLPQHPGYNGLIHLYVEVEEWESAIRLCTQAKKQGWQGDWETEILRLEAKVRAQ
ncbi:hypothetical protein [Desmospora activa]|uniref:Uncharacterized protein n=1 Tax=Desmospora activa DSM 45169 TaxID=1121389 RepID=A0A2T4ZAI5_9BACL|nr:hypothetical protein [Desmospora activa]PTM58902.1 hypothetical protein C8J48_1501 [Desmospora activa DSM 45169]